jgi:hypothetical protein
MKLAIMQPYFFPYIWYFALIKHTDRFIAFDTVQFIRHGWIERNRILKPNEGWQYIQVPLVKHSRNIIIKDVKIRVAEPWQDHILGQLAHYKKSAPYYFEVVDLMRQTLAYNTDNICQLNFHLLYNTCLYLGIPFNGSILSNININISPVYSKDEWALNICTALGVSTYVNPSGGIEIFDRNKYKKAGVEINFLKLNIIPYNQRRSCFEESLSIIDVMMFNHPKIINKMLDDIIIL